MSTSNELSQKRQQLVELHEQVRRLEGEILEAEAGKQWEPKRFYWTFHATTGAMLGGLAAIVSLVFNVVCAPIAGKHPLEIIRVYLTFPLGEKALQLSPGVEGAYAIPDGVILAIGCCLYLGTGMLMGALFQMVLDRTLPKASLVTRMIAGGVLGAVVWSINFYLILSWLQPALFGGRWIVDNRILPWWVALATHIVFGITMGVLQPLGTFSKTRRQVATDIAAA